ncbi:hypothetical protein PVK06_006716 [Gossypium arboreum]|uniref:Auxin-responsive protein n=1 Tax=Gossypium arboreum TaxID=29729 RepID=A0ABR0QFG6_GOSAR|nr:hypothetical protein PVK06_006716 [Gossypium arboreum]
MFAKDKKCDEDDYILTYQDKEGEWLTAGDIPWHGVCEKSAAKGPFYSGVCRKSDAKGNDF